MNVLKSIEEVDFAKGDGLVPVVVQDENSGRVLMLGYMNKAALAKTIKTQQVTFYSRSKKRLWTKGETSGHFLKVSEILSDCDHDTLLVKAIPVGPVCHTGDDTCFGERNNARVLFLDKLSALIKDRKQHPSEGSYTTSLFQKGINKIAQKVGEEAVELVIEAKDDRRDLFIGEAADLLFHYLVLLEAKDISLDEVIGELMERR